MEMVLKCEKLLRSLREEEDDMLIILPETLVQGRHLPSDGP